LKNFDDVTYYIKLATDILFVKNPVSTSMGTLFGVSLHGIVGVFSPFIQSFEVIKLSAFTVFHFIAIGIFGFNIPSYVNRHKVSPKIEMAMRLISEQLKEQTISKSEANRQYRELISKAVADAKVSDERNEPIRSNK